jgi:hypothetical protein
VLRRIAIGRTERRLAMAKVIDFYTPPEFRKKEHWVPAVQRGKVIQFCLQERSMREPGSAGQGVVIVPSESVRDGYFFCWKLSFRRLVTRVRTATLELRGGRRTEFFPVDSVAGSAVAAENGIGIQRRKTRNQRARRGYYGLSGRI